MAGGNFFLKKKTKKLKGFEKMTPSTVVPQDNIPTTVHLPENPKHWNSLKHKGRSYLEDVGFRTSRIRVTVLSFNGWVGRLGS